MSKGCQTAAFCYFWSKWKSRNRLSLLFPHGEDAPRILYENGVEGVFTHAGISELGNKAGQHVVDSIGIANRLHIGGQGGFLTAVHAQKELASIPHVDQFYKILRDLAVRTVGYLVAFFEAEVYAAVQEHPVVVQVRVALDVADHGVLCLTAKDKVRLLPALNIPMDTLKKAVEILKAVCAEE